MLNSFVFSHGASLAENVAEMAAVSGVVAVKRRKCRSGACIGCCRRLYAYSVAALVFPAAFCGAKGAIRWLLPCLPPFISATIFSH